MLWVSLSSVPFHRSRFPLIPHPCTAQHVGSYSLDQGIELEPLNWQRLDSQGSPLDLDFLSGV